MNLNGVHHLTNLTADMDRLIEFYERVFDAEVMLDMEEEGLRHAFIRLGPSTFLHPFQVPGVEVPQGDVPMFARGRLDHYGLNADSEETFWKLRDAVREAGAGVDNAVVTDMGNLLSFTYEDPDGARHEVIWTRSEKLDPEELQRSRWKTIE